MDFVVACIYLIVASLGIDTLRSLIDALIVSQPFNLIGFLLRPLIAAVDALADLLLILLAIVVLYPIFKEARRLRGEFVDARDKEEEPPTAS